MVKKPPVRPVCVPMITHRFLHGEDHSPLAPNKSIIVPLRPTLRCHRGPHFTTGIGVLPRARLRNLDVFQAACYCACRVRSCQPTIGNLLIASPCIWSAIQHQEPNGVPDFLFSPIPFLNRGLLCYRSPVHPFVPPGNAAGLPLVLRTGKQPSRYFSLLGDADALALQVLAAIGRV